MSTAVPEAAPAGSARLARSGAISMASQLVHCVLGLAAMMVLARVLGKESFGESRSSWRSCWSSSWWRSPPWRWC
jgi:hypothetical protein